MFCVCVHMCGCVCACLAIFWTFWPISIKFQRKVRISKLWSIFKFCDNTYLALQIQDKLRNSFLTKNSKTLSGIGFTAHRTSFIMSFWIWIT